jgi:Holliday junction resolvase
MGKMQRAKGARGERELVNLLIGAGHKARRTAPLQTFKQNDMPDVLAEIEGKEVSFEVKLRKDSFKTIYKFLEGNDFLALKANGEKWLVVQPLEQYLEGKNEKLKN